MLGGPNREDTEATQVKDKPTISTENAKKIRNAQVAAILKRLQEGKTITAAQQKLIDQETEKPKGSEQTERLYTINELSRLLDKDPKTLGKQFQRVGLIPAGKVKGRNGYRMSDAQASFAAKPEKTLKDEKILEEIRKLRIANDAREGKLISRELVNSTLAHAFGEITRLLDQKLENELPALLQGLDIPGCRVKGKQLNDSIRSKLSELVSTWPE